MSKTTEAVIKGSKRFHKNVKALRKEFPELTFKEAMRHVKDRTRPDDNEPQVKLRPSDFPDEKKQKLVLFAGNGAFKLVAVSNGNSKVKIKELDFTLITAD